jgi:cytochrome b6-f complex iron-sulfur subunit
LADESASTLQVKDRRKFLEFFLGTSIFASIISFLYPAFRYMIPPKTEELASDTVLAGRVGELKPNTGKIFRFGNRPGLLVLSSDGNYHAISAVCTHLNCTVQYRPDLRDVWCACHNGMYSVEGRNVSGPPPKPLEEYQVVIKADQIFVRRA